MTLLNTSPEAEARTLTKLGVVVIAVIVAVSAISYLMAQLSARHPSGVISVAIETPYVGQGVDVGTPVIMHGVKIGQVVSVTSISGGGVRLSTDLQQGPARGLTDAMTIDYRPSNYFGVTGINVIPAKNGLPLRSGMQINTIPIGNFSLQALIYRFGELTNGVFDQRLISVIERATRYSDGLNPLLETALMVGTSVAKVQTVSTARLLRNSAGISVAFPSMIDSLIFLGNEFLHTYFVDFDSDKFKKVWRWYPMMNDRTKQNYENMARLARDTLEKNDEYLDRYWISVFDTARTDLFSRVGYLESSHVNDLFPVLESVRTLTDAVPKIMSPDSFASTLTQLRTRFEHMYAGSGDQRALQVKLILDRLPGVAAPLGVAPLGGRS